MSVDTRVKLIEFNQYGSSGPEDRLLLFAARAKDLYRWAGIPRKGWHIRMLYQRWVKPVRASALSEFWTRAARPRRELGELYILGPTAITLAIQEEIEIIGGEEVRLHYNDVVDLDLDPTANVGRLALLVKPRVLARLSPDQREKVQEYAASGPLRDLPDCEHDYVLEFAYQLEQMAVDPAWFAAENNVSDSDLRELVIAFEALCRPALVVDGQHRLRGAAESSDEVWLPVVAMPHCTWEEQIYQFIVINEKAEKVDSGLLTDIFGSSLTRHEQKEIRNRLSRARVDVEARIASVVANRDPRSPFYGMVRVPIGTSGTVSPSAYISDTTIRLLIDGGGRGAVGWRSDDDFYEICVKPRLPLRADWDSWTNGKWIEYWFAFWRTVAEYFNSQAEGDGHHPPLWNESTQTNLTKAATLRTIQRLFIDKYVDSMLKIEAMRPLLVEALGEDNADEKIKRKQLEEALPESPEAFAQFVVDRFLKYLPVRIFAAPWVGSLDDAEGLSNLYAELEKAFDRTRAGKTYRIGNRDVFAAASASNDDE
ncbi:MAG: hypothetical protein ACK51E_02730 [Gemmatimonadota bacterium]